MDEAHARKLAEAAKRYGKPFAHEITVDRIKPPSTLLKEIRQRAEQLRREEEARDAVVVETIAAAPPPPRVRRVK